MPLSPEKPQATNLAGLGDALSGFIDPNWYQSRYPDVAASGLDPIRHFLLLGLAGNRDEKRCNARQ